MNELNIADNDVALVFTYDEPDDLVKTTLCVVEESESEISPLSPEEQQERTECEKEINEGLEAIATVGYRLYLIKSKRLYRSTHQSFTKYCKKVWGLSRVHANRKIDLHETSELLKSEPKGSVCIPAKETHNRVLAGCTPEEKVKIAKAVKEKTKEKAPTEKDWKETRTAIVPHPVIETHNPVEQVSSQMEPGAKIIPLNFPVLVQSPQDTFKTGKIKPLTELHEMAEKLYNISGDPSKKAEAAKLMAGLQRWLKVYADWEAQFVNNVALKEAA